ncbi:MULTISPECIES: glycine betaine uptake BCCT transporter [Virgibacillus]|uniref:Glycine betaine transporter OpuD n=1 Tax=Virgibacillus massiliensis TaxID=1462526 RepID=A0A024Q6W1_9BACI|nr:MULTISPECIES: BCCT family transporter [Virgibacillus]EQB38493.1 glycine/betaine ABC transporter permease [Virgibacillus sp. CM-4]MYL41199.1 BCCT family transporter [Virgibacillus massiliensis]CDQ37997.1 Glycine betaine transporter OpuD [Virgibacillus massiliensis]
MKKVTSVFWITLGITLALSIWGSIAPSQFEDSSVTVMDFISGHFGWFYLIIVSFFVIFCLYLIFSPYGKIKLGKHDDKPEFSYPTWFAMLFSAGMGIGLVFYGVASPVSHYIKTPPVAEPGTVKALEDALRLTFFHYGVHAWAIYAVIALVLAYFTFRHDKPGLISAALEPLFGNAMEGVWGKTVDVIAVFATIVGVATTLGFGAAQINGGLSYLLGIDNAFWVQLVIILVVTVLFMLSTYTGLSKGIKYLSNTNLVLAALLFLAVLILGPTMYIVNSFTNTIGTYIQSLPIESFRIAPNDSDEQQWIIDWTVFFWAWWIAWSPFVGIFIARISRGRTIREFLSGVLIVPSVVGFLWFSAFGMAGIQAQNSGVDIAGLPDEQALFGMFSNLPFSVVLSILALLLISTFFITSADSATFVLGMQTTNGSLSPSTPVKFVWGFAQSAIAAVLLYTGGLQALQNALISAAFPFSIIMLLMIVSFYKALKKDKKQLSK